MSYLKLAFWNPRERRLRTIPRLLLAMLMAIALLVPFICLMGVGMSFLDMANGEMSATVEELASHPILLLGQAVIMLLVIVALVILAAHLLDRRHLSDLGVYLKRRGWWLDLAFGLALGALLMGLVFLVELALGWVRITGLAQSAVERVPFVPGMVGAAIAYLCVGIYEELLMRGYIMRNMAEGLRDALTTAQGSPRPAVWAAWILSSLFFGLAHAANPGTSWMSHVQLGVAGLLLGLGYLLTGDLAIPIGLHITWNFFQGPIFGFPVSGVAQQVSLIAIAQGGPDLWTGGAFGPEAGIIGLLAMLLGGGLTWAWVRWRQGSARALAALAVPSLLEERPDAPAAAAPTRG